MNEADHLLVEIRDNIAKKDAIKARLVLAHLEHVGKNAREQAIMAFHDAAPEFAVPLLARFLVEHKSLTLDMPVVREILAVKILSQPGLVAQALRDPQTPHRQVYVSMAGELRLESLVPDLLDALLATSEIDDINHYIEVLGEIA
ncbi:MAG: response regulator, partial [Deltaproteobacteria bacterium]|nr:response regulator [Deltaproteobacteria bacterium]